MQNTHDVIILGAGIVGSTMALACARQGLRVALLDKQQPSTVTSEMNLRVSNINLASEQFLNTLGVEFPANRCGIFNNIQIFQDNDFQTLNFPASVVGLPYLGSIIENNVLISLLHAALQPYAVDFYWPVTAEKIEFTAQSVLLYSQEKNVLGAPLIIGAEGAHSWLRERCAIAQDEKPYGQTALVAHIATAQPHEHTAYQRFLPQGPLAYLPLHAAQQCSIVWSSAPSHIDSLTQLSDETLAQEIASAMMHRLGDVKLISTRATFPLWMRHAQHYIAPRVALIGDAVHTIHPLAGIGANLGLMDVASLAQVILWATQHGRDWGSFALLRRYERERRTSNALMLHVVKLLALNKQPMPRLRNLGIRLLEHSTPIKRIMMQCAQRA